MKQKRGRKFQIIKCKCDAYSAKYEVSKRWGYQCEKELLQNEAFKAHLLCVILVTSLQNAKLLHCFTKVFCKMANQERLPPLMSPEIPSIPLSTLTKRLLPVSIWTTPTTTFQSRITRQMMLKVERRSVAMTKMGSEDWALIRHFVTV